MNKPYVVAYVNQFDMRIFINCSVWIISIINSTGSDRLCLDSSLVWASIQMFWLIEKKIFSIKFKIDLSNILSIMLWTMQTLREVYLKLSNRLVWFVLGDLALVTKKTPHFRRF